MASGGGIGGRGGGGEDCVVAGATCGAGASKFIGSVPDVILPANDYGRGVGGEGGGTDVVGSGDGQGRSRRQRRSGWAVMVGSSIHLNSLFRFWGNGTPRCTPQCWRKLVSDYISERSSAFGNLP